MQDAEAVPADMLDRITGALDAALRVRDGYTHSHCGRVVTLALELGRTVGLGRAALRLLGTCARFHDIGKIGIPDEILRKPGPLSGAEYERIKSHSRIGASIIGQVDAPDMDECARIILHHHEHFNGNGYPDGLTGDEIPLCSRIIALADTYDALTSRRSYRDSMPAGGALDAMRGEVGLQFDPRFAERFFRMLGA